MCPHLSAVHQYHEYFDDMSSHRDRASSWINQGKTYTPQIGIKHAPPNCLFGLFQSPVIKSLQTHKHVTHPVSVSERKKECWQSTFDPSNCHRWTKVTAQRSVIDLWEKDNLKWTGPLLAHRVLSFAATLFIPPIPGDISLLSVDFMTRHVWTVVASF